MKKRYFVMFTSDKSENCMAGNSNTLKTAKTIIKKIRNNYAYEKPRNFKVFDSYGEIDAETDFVPCVYSEQ